MNANAYPQRDTRQVSELEGAHKRQDVQRHTADIHCMPVPITLWQPGGHHVGVTYGLHLRGDGRSSVISDLIRPSAYLSVPQLSIPCKHRGGQRCCQSPRRCHWACPRPPLVCCTGTEWWSQLCHWNILSPPRTAPAPPPRSPSGFSPPGCTETRTQTDETGWSPLCFLLIKGPQSCEIQAPLPDITNHHPAAVCANWDSLQTG